MATTNVITKRKLPSLPDIKRLIGDNWLSFVTGLTGGVLKQDAAQNNIAAGAGGAISITNYSTTINADAGGDAFTLANGTVVGQLKKIRLVATAGGTAVITGAFVGGTTLTITAAASYVELRWNGTAWRMIEFSGAAIT